MRTQHIGPLVGQAKVRGTPHNQGDGLRMAFAVGAMPWGQCSGCHSTPISADWGEFAPRELTDKSNRLSYVYGRDDQPPGHAASSMRARTPTCSPTPSSAASSWPSPAPWPGRSSISRSCTCWSRAIPPASRSPRTRWRSWSGCSTSTTTTAGDQDAARVQRRGTRRGSGFDPTKKDGVSTRGLTPEKTNWGIKLTSRRSSPTSATGGITFTFGGLKVNESTQVIGTDWRPLQGAICLRRDDRRAVLRQLSGRHRTGFGRNLRPDRRPQRCGGDG